MNYCVFFVKSRVGIEIPVDSTSNVIEIERYVHKHMSFIFDNNITYDCAELYRVKSWGYTIITLD